MHLSSALALLALTGTPPTSPTSPAPSSSPAASQPPAEARGLCGGTEQVFFSCAVKTGKWLSVCGSKDLSDSGGRLTYRFGAPGKVELEVSNGTKPASELFTYGRYTRPGTTLLSLRFQNGGAAYSVRSDTSNEDGSDEASSGVTVTVKGKETTLDCTQPVVDHLMLLERFLPVSETDH